MQAVGDAKYRVAENYVQAALDQNKKAKKLIADAEKLPEGGSTEVPKGEEPKNAEQLQAEAAKLKGSSTGYYKTGVTHLNELLKDWHEGKGRLAGVKGEKITKTYKKAYGLLGWAYDGAGDKENAVKAFADYLKKYPDPEGEDKNRASSMFLLATLLIELEKTTEAGQVLEQLSVKYPEEGKKALPKMGKVMFEVGQYAKAIDAWTKIFAENVEVTIGDLKWAAAKLWNCKPPHTKDGALLALKAIAKLSQAIEKPVLADWIGENKTKAIANDPKAIAAMIQTLKEQLLWNGSNAGFQAEEYEKCIKHLDKVLEKDETAFYVDGRLLRAMAYRKLKKYGPAVSDYADISMYGTFSKKMKFYYMGQDKIGDTYVEQELYDKALGGFDIIAMTDLTDDPDLPENENLTPDEMFWIEYAVYMAALCNSKLGKIKEKEELIKKYRKHFPSGKYIKEITNLPGAAAANKP